MRTIKIREHLEQLRESAELFDEALRTERITSDEMESLREIYKDEDSLSEFIANTEGVDNWIDYSRFLRRLR